MTDGQQSGGFMHGPDVLTLLNRDMANELNTMLMYMVGGLIARGPDALDFKETAAKFSKMEFKHVQKLAARIVELEGTPELLPLQVDSNASITARLPKDGAIQPLLQDALENELHAVVEYKSQVQRIGFDDPTTRRLLEEILADKEHQAEEVRNLLGA